MQLEDWRQAPLDQLAPWYESERRRWIRDLRWDPAEAWREVEHARASWGLPGLVALGFGLSRFMKASGRESYADFGDDLDTQPGFDNGLEADDDDETIADDLAAFRASPSSQDASSPTRPGELP